MYIFQGLLKIESKKLFSICQLLYNKIGIFMPSGGARAGAGRKKGLAVKISRTQLLADRMACEGKLPLEVLLDGMRYFHDKSIIHRMRLEHFINKFGLYDDDNFTLTATEKDRYRELRAAVKDTMFAARDYAVAAAPMIHPRLTAIAAQVSDANHNGPIGFQVTFAEAANNNTTDDHVQVTPVARPQQINGVAKNVSGGVSFV